MTRFSSLPIQTMSCILLLVFQAYFTLDPLLFFQLWFSFIASNPTTRFGVCLFNHVIEKTLLQEPETWPSDFQPRFCDIHFSFDICLGNPVWNLINFFSLHVLTQGTTISSSNDFFTTCLARNSLTWPKGLSSNQGKGCIILFAFFLLK